MQLVLLYSFNMTNCILLSSNYGDYCSLIPPHSHRPKFVKLNFGTNTTAVVACEFYVLLWSHSARFFPFVDVLTAILVFLISKGKERMRWNEAGIFYLKFLQIGINLGKCDYGISKQHIFGVNCNPLKSFTYGTRLQRVHLFIAKTLLRPSIICNTFLHVKIKLYYHRNYHPWVA